MKKFLFLLLSCLLWAVTVRAEFYLFTDLGAYGSYTYFGPSGINNQGTVVGTAYESAGRPVAFSHRAGSFFIAPSPGPSHSTWGNAINDSGTIVGFCDRTGHPSGNVLHAFYANPGSASVDFDGNFARNSEAKAINKLGYVVGSLTGQSFLGHLSGWIMPLGTTLGNDFSARGLNNHFVVVGNGINGGMTYDALTGTTTLLGFSFPLNWTNRASAINDGGIVAGKLGLKGFLYNAGSVALFGTGVAEILGMNAGADVVGSTTSEHAFVYLKSSGHFIDLNTVVASSVSAQWTLTRATGINDNGVICAQARRLATLADGPDYGMYVYRAVKLTPFFFLPVAPRPLPLPAL